MRDIAKRLYEENPGLNEKMPVKDSKILVGVEVNLEPKVEIPILKKSEDWHTKYREALAEYRREKARTIGLNMKKFLN